MINVKNLISRIILYSILVVAVIYFYPAIMRFNWSDYKYRQKEDGFDFYTDLSQEQFKVARTLCLEFKRKFEKCYFPIKNKKRLKIYLFSGDKGYEKFCKKAKCEGTEFGFYAPGEKLLVVNTASGWGTLLHEITHYFLSTTKVKYPDWFEEGFAAFFEKFIGKVDEKKNEVFWLSFGYFNPWRFSEVMVVRGSSKLLLSDLFNQKKCIQSIARNFILFTHHKGLLPGLLQELRKGTDSRGAVETIFKKDLPTIEQEWNNWIDESVKTRDCKLLVASQLFTSLELQNWCQQNNLIWSEEKGIFVCLPGL